MDFSLTEDQLMIQELVEKIISERVTDDFWRDSSLLSSKSNSACGWDQPLWSLLAEAGLLSVALPESVGGMGLGFVELCLLLQAQGRRLAPVPLLSSLVMGAMPLVKFGSETQQQKYLPSLAAGETMLTGVSSELVHSVKTMPFSAQQQDGQWVLNGQVDGVAYAEQSAAIIVPVTVREAGDEKIAIFIVEPGFAGVTLNTQQTTSGEPVAQLQLNNVQLSDEQLLSAPEQGATHWKIIEQHLLVGLAAIALGVADDALRRTAEYSVERKQFGMALHSFQSVAHRAADAYIDCEAMRTTLWQAAWRLSVDEPAEAEVRVAKWWACEGGHRVAHSAQHLHGGIGSDIEFPLHRYFLWAKQLEFTGGASSFQLEKLGEQIAQQAGV